MDLKGPTIRYVQKEQGGIFKPPQTCNFVAQILQCLRSVHMAGYVHADLKPTNLLFGIGETLAESVKNIYIVDFGLSRKYVDQKGRHISENSGQGTRGTLSFMSIKTQQGISMSRRDDIESLAYIAIYLVKGILPWSRLKQQEKSRMYQETLYCKKTANLKAMCVDLPSVFLDFVKYARNMKFAE